jgi:hypothetical protein
MTHKPPNDLGRFVRAVVVHDHVHVAIGRQRGVHALKEFEKLLMPMTAMTLADDFSRRDFQGGNERSGAVANVVVGLAGRDARAHRQEGRVRSRACT